MDLPSGIKWAPQKDVPQSRRLQVTERDDEYVIQRLVSHARAEDDSGWLVRVRWAGFSSNDDTWEPASALPADMLKRYEHRKRLAPGTLTAH
jgi:hypothetical protein